MDNNTITSYSTVFNKIKAWYWGETRYTVQITLKSEPYKFQGPKVYKSKVVTRCNLKGGINTGFPSKYTIFLMLIKINGGTIVIN